MSKKPARLDKVDDSYYLSDRIDAWCSRHFLFCLTIALILFSILFVALCFAVVGASATDSGLQYNQLNNII